MAEIPLPEDVIGWESLRSGNDSIYKVASPPWAGPVVPGGPVAVNWLPVDQADRTWEALAEPVKGIKQYMFYRNEGGPVLDHTLGFITTINGTREYTFTMEAVGRDGVNRRAETDAYKITATGLGPHYIKFNFIGRTPNIVSVE